MKDTNPIEFIKIQRAAVQCAADAYEEDEEWCPTKISRLLEACKIIEQLLAEKPVCPNCGDSDIRIFVDAEDFGGTAIFVPIHSCNKCGFGWTDEIGGTVWDKNRALLKVKDEQIEELKRDVNNLNGELITLSSRSNT